MHPSMHRNERGSFVYYTCDRLPVRHAFTTKFGGVSRGDCESLNLGFNRGDERENVLENYRILAEQLGMDEGRITMTKQIHDTQISVVTEGEAGMAVRSMPLIRLGGAAGTGLADGKAARTVADNAPGTWNTLYVKVVDDRITLVENGVKVAENAVMTNLCAPGEPVYAQGRIELAGQGALVAFRNLWINELPSTPVFSLPADEAAAGYEVLFDGRSLYKWTGNTTNYVPLDGTIDVTATYGGSGNLYTVGEYGDFILRFEFRFLTEGVNNGIGIRTPMGVDAAFHGMEIQILDHDAPIYKDISDYQQHGSVYGVIAADRVKFGELGEWNTEEIRAVGDRITVTVNGRVILDGNIREACRGHNVSEDGSKVNPYTVDHRNHPGLFNKSGHIGLLGHGAGIQFRNLRVLDLGAGRK